MQAIEVWSFRRKGFIDVIMVALVVKALSTLEARSQVEFTFKLQKEISINGFGAKLQSCKNA